MFSDHLEDATLYRLSASRQRAELLERLFPDGVDELPRLESARDQSYTLNMLALAYDVGGEPGRAVPLCRRAVEIDEREDFAGGAAVKLSNLSEALRQSGALREAEAAARRVLRIGLEEKDRFLEGVSLYLLGMALAVCGNEADSEIALRRSLALWQDQSQQQSEGLTNAYLAQRLLWFRQPEAALPLAGRAWELAAVHRNERDFIRSARLQGAASLGIGDLDTAAERLQHALTRARAVNYVQEELPALAGLAELRRRNQQFTASRDLLDQVWDLAERGPFPLEHADALNVLAQIERDQGNHEAAIAAAEKACRLAWCDGPPYAYAYALTNAREHLQALNAPEPDLPPFDESKFEPMPDVDINPKDEFHVEAQDDS
ncbi:MAG: tetratricopeptide repeat protein [Planctomycetota bacterium]|nr:tetratricopeptide repeat protein [Planctomycetota bacterium]